MLENDTLEIIEERDKQLKSCPFCGEAAHLFIASNRSQVTCKHCQASTAVYKGLAAINAWNKRSANIKGIRNCGNCKWYRLNEDVKDEIGKHECYAYSLICSPLCLGYELESGCDKFEQKGNETEEEIRREWRKRMFRTDKSTELLAKSLMKRDLERVKIDER